MDQPEQEKPQSTIREMVLTGGPCAGKTTALGYLSQHLKGRGWRVLVVPEAATLLISGGIYDMVPLAVGDRETYLAVQEQLMRVQAELRERYLALAASIAELRDEKILVVYDRAELDNKAYLTDEEFAQLTQTVHSKTPEQVANTYEAVIHLTTAADGAEHAYTLENNQARQETPQQAIALDKAVRNSWLGHPHFTVIGNTTTGGFDAKLAHTLAAVLNFLGEPEPVEIERKWLLAEPPSPEQLAEAVPVFIEQTYLIAGPQAQTGEEQRVRARTQGEHTAYFHTIKKPLSSTSTSPGGRVEVETKISYESYRLLLQMKDPNKNTIRKTRYCFVDGGQHFELDHFTNPVQAWLLEAELISAGQEVKLPDALSIDREVTDDPQWKNSTLAQM